jgi:prepilin peptidase CpaA
MEASAAMQWVAVCVLAGCAVVWDVATGRVPNRLTFGAAAIAIAAAAVRGGLSAALWSAGGFFVGLALFLPLFALGGLGAGDVKLVAALGAWLGPMGAVYVAIWAAIAGGLFALVVAIRHRYLGEAVRNVAALVGVWSTTGPSPVAGMTLKDSAGPRLAYAVPIGVAALVTLWLKQF